jgi:hypothetical protein
MCLQCVAPSLKAAFVVTEVGVPPPVHVVGMINVLRSNSKSFLATSRARSIGVGSSAHWRHRRCRSLPPVDMGVAGTSVADWGAGFDEDDNSIKAEPNGARCLEGIMHQEVATGEELEAALLPPPPAHSCLQVHLYTCPQVVCMSEFVVGVIEGS